VNSLSPIGIVHEQSPKTTHNGLRFAVEALSGGFHASLRLLTIYAGNAKSVRFGLGARTNGRMGLSARHDGKYQYGSDGRDAVAAVRLFVLEHPSKSATSGRQSRDTNQRTTSPSLASADRSRLIGTNLVRLASTFIRGVESSRSVS
jgi:hypothetical protein